jgi:Ca2+/Na+ antiporter
MLKPQMTKKNILTDIAGVFGMTTLIIVRLDNNIYLKSFLAIIFLVFCVFYTIQSLKKEKTITMNINDSYKIFHYSVYVSLLTILFLLIF